MMYPARPLGCDVPQFCPQCLFLIPGSNSEPAANCPRCRKTLTLGVATLERKIPTTRTPLPVPAKPLNDGRTQARGTVRLLTIPANLQALRDPQLETLSQPSLTPPGEFASGVTGAGPGHASSTAQTKPQHAKAASTPEIPDHVPGYRIEGVIGHGGMGSVYLARQLSLDRPVALKVMSKVWASDPVFVARFVREAYAAALLNHPNVVQIYDIGEAQSLRYFSMEYVVGSSLSEVIKKKGKLDPTVAVGYIVQAAKGLKHAHDRGIIHRDIKPDNLLLEEHGMVKVADLGLVKTPDLSAYQDRLSDNDSPSGLHAIPTDMTGCRMALGTPAYMAPEQCRDAATVDHRADIYSLGCTLYALVTGQQPFQAESAFSLMKKHAYEALVPPEEIVPRLPKDLSAIIQRMMAKHPGDRYGNMGEVIRILESWLGVQSTAPRFTPREDQIAEVEQLSSRFRNAPTAVLRQRLIGGFLSTTAIFALLLLFFGQVNWAFGLAGLVVQSSLAYFALSGWSRNTYLFRRWKQFALGMSRGDWLVTIAGGGLFVAFLWMSKLLLAWAGFGLIGIAIAGAVWFILDRRIVAERQGILDSLRMVKRQLRRQLVAEPEILHFIAKYSGKHWEEFFEEMFGFEEKLAIRETLTRGGAAGAREKFASWREPLLNVLNHVEASRKKAREKGLIERAEAERLIAAGVPKRIARDRAAIAAETMVEQASVIRAAEGERDLTSSTLTAPNLRAFMPEHSLAYNGYPNDLPQRDYLGTVIDFVVGVPVRVILASLLIASCILWCIQNELWQLGAYQQTDALVIQGVSPEWTSWCDTANVGWGAMLLLVSLFYRGQRTAALAILGAGVCVLGHKFGIRTVEPIQDFHVALLLGTVLALVGYRMGRR